ncbi:hypothetical protein GE09DRAFT_1106410 [Coniochaeta sp. 2T2.1]|nr:hypothetical protein GE09DRAFT_1106410 [Coniochaeta sp. 2T2.1]
MAELKKAFEDDALIYSFTTEEWLCTSDCLWSSATEIPGKVILNEDYDDEDRADLRDFFLDVLGVQEMTLDMIFDKLENETVELTAEDFKQTLLACSSLLSCEDEEVLRELRQEKRNIFFHRKVFPIRLSSGEIQLCEGSMDFSLIDRHSLAEDFAGKAKFLDFDMGEVRLLQPFISWIGLEGRYLSKMVREISSADSNSTRPISDPQREIRRRAHALLRIAKTYNSPRTWGDLQSAYSLLRNAETLETGHISTQLHLHQDGEDLVVEKEQGIAVHIYEGPEGLRIYIPRAKRDRGACFQTKLPQRLCEWLMTDPTTQIVEKVSNEATCAVLSVLNAPLYSLSGILDQCGINIIDLAPEEGEYDEADISDDDQSDESDPRVAEQPIQRGCHPSQAGELDNTQSESSNSDDDRFTLPSTAEDTRTVSYEAMRHRSNRSHFPQTGPVQIDAGVDMGYLTMLSRAVTSARNAQFPSHGPFNMSVLQAAIANDADGEYDSDGPLRLRSTSRTERDRKVGAAGELYVFELLSRLEPELPGFSRNNWQSTIRKCVRIHPDYADLAAWTGSETADITYRDSGGELTSLLIDKGFMSHVSAEQLTNARPQYFIEVKTTTLACETPFFMSKYQYARVCRRREDAKN